MNVAINEQRDRVNEIVGLDNKGGKIAEMERRDAERDAQYSDVATTMRTVDKRLEAQHVQLKWLVGIAAAVALTALGAVVTYLVKG